MPAKGTVDPNAAISSQYRLEIVGLPEILFVRVGELERTVVMAEMPDKTMQVTGQVQPGEFEADMMLHHGAERAALEALHQLAATGTPGHKVQGTLHFLGANGADVKLSVLIDGLICKGRKTPELSAGDDGTGVPITWMFSYDDLIHLG